MEKYKEEINSLNKEEQELRNRLNAVRNRKREIEESIFLETYGVQFGEMIEYVDGSIVCTGMLFRFDGHYGWVYPTKKDGTVGKAERRVWRTESIKPITLKTV